MSIRDNKRKQNRGKGTNIELANLQAMVEHTAVNTTTINESTNENTAMNTNNQTAPTRIMGETETTASLDLAKDAGIITDPSPDLMAEVMADADVAVETERNTVIVTEWFSTLAPPTPEGFLKGLSLHTVTGHELVLALNLPPIIPSNVANALMAECAKHPTFAKAMPYASILVGTSRNEDGVDVAELLNTTLAFAKPYIMDKVVPNIDKVYSNIMGFIKAPVDSVAAEPVTPPVVAEAPAPKTVTTSIANEGKTINVAVTITEGSGTSDTTEPQVVPEVPVVTDPEALLASWALENPGYSFDKYFEKRNELYINAS